MPGVEEPAPVPRASWTVQTRGNAATVWSAPDSVTLGNGMFWAWLSMMPLSIVTFAWTAPAGGDVTLRLTETAALQLPAASRPLTHRVRVAGGVALIGTLAV